MFSRFVAVSAAALTLVFATSSAHAAEKITIAGGLSDGGLFSGWFDFDSSFDVTAWDIVTTAGTAMAGDEYKSGGSGQSVDESGFPDLFFEHDADGLEIVPIGPGTLLVLEGEIGIGPERGGFGAFTSSGAPEPGVWVMALLGFGLTGAVLRRRALARA